MEIDFVGFTIQIVFAIIIGVGVGYAVYRYFIIKAKRKLQREMPEKVNEQIVKNEKDFVVDGKQIDMAGRLIRKIKDKKVKPVKKELIKEENKKKDASKK